jgi:hypothetical protein
MPATGLQCRWRAGRLDIFRGLGRSWLERGRGSLERTVFHRPGPRDPAWGAVLLRWSIRQRNGEIVPLIRRLPQQSDMAT